MLVAAVAGSGLRGSAAAVNEPKRRPSPAKPATYTASASTAVAREHGNARLPPARPKAIVERGGGERRRLGCCLRDKHDVPQMMQPAAVCVHVPWSAYGAAARIWTYKADRERIIPPDGGMCVCCMVLHCARTWVRVRVRGLVRVCLPQ